MSIEVETVAVTGAGVMGSQISQVLAAAGLTVVLHDVSSDAFATALDRIENGPFGLRASVRRGKLTEAEASAALERISTTTDLGAACQGIDMAIEAVPEVLGLKQEVFKIMDRFAPAHAVLTSNTGGLPITALAHATNRPGRVLGWHWAQPCAVMKVAEVVTTPASDSDAVDAVVQTARRAGKNPQVIRDNPMAWGFVANRVYLQIGREAKRIVAEGVATPEQVDAILRDCFRWPAGPFEMSTGAGTERPKVARPEDILGA